MLEPIFVFGASGHAKVVIDASIQQGYQIAAVFDDDASVAGTRIMGNPVLGGREALLQWRHEHSMASGIVAIGGNAARANVAAWLLSAGMKLATVIHPRATIAAGATIGAGSVVMAGAVVNSDVRVGSNCIINTAASIDHDCQLGDAVHIGPGCRLCGNVRISNGVLLGVGTVAISGIAIGEDAVVGAGSVVIREVAPRTKVAGSPAKKLR